MRSFLLFMLLFGVASLQAAEVEVTVEGIDEIKGRLLIGFFTNEEDFQIKPIEQSPNVEVTAVSPVVVVAKDLEPGVYAIAVIWDWNMNGELDKAGPFRKPTEPYGFSNNPRIFVRSPKFEDCAFTVTEEGGKITVTLNK